MPGIFGLMDLDHSINDTFELMKKTLNYIPKFKMQEEKIDLGLAGKLSLPIFDKGDQTSWNIDKTIMIMIDGYIVNGDELIEKYGLDHKLKESSWSELCIKLYEKLGKQFIKELNGSFNMFISDSVDNKIILANDRFGHRPLYYYAGDKHLIYSYEFKGVLCDRRIPRKLDLDSVGSLFAFGYVWGDRTLIEGVRMLDAASILEWDASGTKIENYWFVKYPTDQDQKDPVDLKDIDHYLDLAMKRIKGLTGNKILFLSGGLDSRAIGCYFNRHDIEYSTGSFGTSETNDVKIAKQVSDKLSKSHTAYGFNTQQGEKILKDFLKITDGMVSCAYMSNALPWDEMGKTWNIAVHGNGGDLLFGSYYRLEFDQLPKDDKAYSIIFKSYNTGFTKDQMEKLFKPKYSNRIWNGTLKMFKDAYPANKDHSANRISEYLCFVQKVKRYVSVSPWVINNHMEPVNPFFDNDLIDLTLNLSESQKENQNAYIHTLIEQFPETMSIPRVHGIDIEEIKTSLFKEDIKKKRIKRLLALPKMAYRKYISNKLFPQKIHYWNLEYMTRHEFKDVFRDFVLDKRTLDRGFFDPDELKRLWYQHTNAFFLKNNSPKLALIVSFEYFCRTFLDDEPDLKLK